MPTKPILSPKSLNEWTLEENIVREISNLFDTPFGLFYPVRLRNIFDISRFDLTRLSRHRTKSYKLTPGEEGRSTGGWDAKFAIPPARGRDSRVLYLQIKSGKHSEGNYITGSIFNSTIANPNPHAEFTFNDNGDPKKSKAANQHEALKNLNDYLIAKGFSEKSVMYCFPRITDLAKFDKLEQPLIYYTTFLSHSQMDKEADANGADLYDGKLHHFRTCYVNEKKREISSKPFKLSGNAESAGFLQEVMMVKLARLWNNYHNLINNHRLRDYLTFALADTLGINPFERLNDSPKLFYQRFQSDLNPYFEAVQQARLQNEADVFGADQQFSNYRTRLFDAVSTFISNFRGRIDINEQIPNIYTNPQSQVSLNPLNMELGGTDILAMVI